MPHTHSAEKSLRQNNKRRIRNRARMKAIKTDVKEFLGAVKAGSPEDAQKAYNAAASDLDRAAAKRTIHPNKAARKKSQMGKLLRKKTAK